MGVKETTDTEKMAANVYKITYVLTLLEILTEEEWDRLDHKPFRRDFNCMP